MSFSYDRYDRRRRQGGRAGPSQRTALGYWLPLAFTVTTATVGLAAWIWSERRDSDDNNDDLIYDRKPRRDRKDDRPPLSDDRPPLTDDRPPLPDAPPSFQTEPRPGETAYGEAASYYQGQEGFEARDVEQEGQRVEEESIISRVSGAIRRTPSPQQLFDGASKRVAAGVAAAGAAMGKGLSAIREQSDDDFQDHERWSEEAESKGAEVDAEAAAAAGAVGRDVVAAQSTAERSIAQSRSNRRLVAVVASAASDAHFEDDEQALDGMDHASILAHLPGDINTEKIQLVILIYAPHLKSHPLSTATAPSANDPQQAARGDSRPRVPRTSSSVSSYSNISTPGAFGDDDDQTQLAAAAAENTIANPPNALYTALVTRAMSLVENPTYVLPFTTPTGHIYMLRHLAPSLVYLQESLTGPQGENVKQIEGWVGQVVVVVGGEGLGGGLIDTETEDEGAGKGNRGAGASDSGKWWMDEARVGLGKGVDVVEGMRVGEDWMKRVSA